ncbi:MAG: twin-arginine translocase subunit TatC [Patescibacteria group bacterium]
MESNTLTTDLNKLSVNKYFPYLSEIRKRLLFLVSIFLISSAVGFIYYEKIIVAIFTLLDLPKVNIVFTSPFQFIDLSINSAILMGTIITFPFVLSQVLSFLRPALSKKEYKLTLYLLPLSLVLFVVGFGFGMVIMRYVVVIFYEKSLALAIGNLLDIGKLLSNIFVTSAFMGLAFQFPIVMTLLMRLKVVKYQTFKKQRLFAYIGSLFFAAILPPTDLLSLVLLCMPLVLLFELTLILNRLFLRSHLL